MRSTSGWPGSLTTSATSTAMRIGRRRALGGAARAGRADRGHRHRPRGAGGSRRRGAAGPAVGWRSIALRGPVLPGDTIRAESRITAAPPATPDGSRHPHHHGLQPARRIGRHDRGGRPRCAVAGGPRNDRWRGGRSNVEFIVHLQVNWPPENDPAELERLVKAEHERAVELAEAGFIKRLWQTPGSPRQLGPVGGAGPHGSPTRRSARCPSSPGSTRRSTQWARTRTTPRAGRRQTRSRNDDRAASPRRRGTARPAGLCRGPVRPRGRVAVVTGGGSGLGRAIGMGFAQAGVTVVLADVNDEGGAETVARIAAQAAYALLASRCHAGPTSSALADRVVERSGAWISWSTALGPRSARRQRTSRRRSSTSSSTSTSRAHTCAARPSGARCLPKARAASSTSPRSGLHRVPLGERLPRLQGRRPWHHPCPRARVARPGRPGQRHRADAHGSPLTSKAAQRTSSPPGSSRRACSGLAWEAAGAIGAAIFLASDAAELVTGHTIMCDDGYLTA